MADSPSPRFSKSIQLFSWALYDCGNSSFSAIIQTFIFAAYFTQHVASDPTMGSSLWGLINGIAGACIAFSAPVFGAIADHGKSRKLWIGAFTLLCILSTSVLWFVKPDHTYTLFALIFVCLAIIGSELAFVFYNSMLPDLANPDQIGKWSGWGWGCGYIGGVVSLSLALILFLDEQALYHGLGKDAVPIRVTFPLVGVWYFLFSLPLFFFTSEIRREGKRMDRAVFAGIKQLITTVKQVVQYKQIALFLIARMFYIDGLVTLFTFAGVYASSLFGMSERDILIFGILMNVGAGVGALGFAKLDDWIGSKRLVLISLIGLIVPSFLILLVSSASLFYFLGLTLSLFVGPVQSASRSLMARLAPPLLRNEMFGFFALSGKATAFLGPLLVGWITYLTGSQTAGMSVIIVFFLVGFCLMLAVTSPKRERL